MPADLTPDLREEVMALWFVDNIYANLPPEVALSAGHVAARALAARLAVPPAASEPCPHGCQTQEEHLALAASEPSDEEVARELAKMLHTETLFGVREDAFVSPVQLVRAVSAARERAKEAR